MCNFASLIFLTTAHWQTPGWRMTFEQCCLLPHISIFNGPRSIFELRTNYISYLPAPCISDGKIVHVAEINTYPFSLC
jgi:hypothetical protein